MPENHTANSNTGRARYCCGLRSTGCWSANLAVLPVCAREPHFVLPDPLATSLHPSVSREVSPYGSIHQSLSHLGLLEPKLRGWPFISHSSGGCKVQDRGASRCGVWWPTDSCPLAISSHGRRERWLWLFRFLWGIKPYRGCPSSWLLLIPTSGYHHQVRVSGCWEGPTFSHSSQAPCSTLWMWSGLV